MPAFPTAAFSKDCVRVRFLAPSLPDSMNRRFLGMPRGVYLGYTPYVAPGADVLQLLRDSNHGFSTLKVGSNTDPVQVDVFTAEDILLDFTGHTVWPVYVIAKATYTAGSSTNGTIFTRGTTASGLDEVLICRVNRPGNDLVVDVDIPTNRQPPIAFQGQKFGFMGQNAVGELSIANSVNAEVIAARSSPYTGPHGSLKDRIDDDVDGDSLANRLGLFMHNILGNAYTGVTGTSWNVSGSFSETSREFEPKITFAPNANELTVGAITAPGDTVRNICFLINETTGARLVDTTNPSVASPTLEPLYGRLTYSTGFNGGGKQIFFYAGVDDIDGGGTNPFVAPLAQGDLILAPDGKYYELKTIVGPDNAVLGAAYEPDTDGFVSNTAYRRFTLSFFNSTGAYSIPSSSTIRFSFPSFQRLTQSVYDAFPFMRKNAELPAVQDATTTVAGKVLQATSGAKAGTVSAENNTSPVGANFHTLNFFYGGATDAGGGVANVSVVGATGPAGPDSDVGPQGPQGSPGAGYTQSIPFLKSSVHTAPFVGQSFSNDFAVSHGFPSLAAVTGGFAQWSSPNGLGTYGQIDSITKVGTTGTILLSASTPGATYAVFLGGCR